MRRLRRSRVALAFAVAIWIAFPAAAVTVKIEYDTSNALGLSSPFFNSGTTQANQAKAALNAAAAYYSNVLTDTLAAIPASQNYTSPRVNMTWTWTMQLSNPNGPGTMSFMNQAVPADEYRIFAGAQEFSGTTLAQSAPGGHPWSRPVIPPNAISADINAILAIDASFGSAVDHRGETTGFADWGGSISFDSDTNWHYLHTTAPAAGKIDFYTV